LQAMSPNMRADRRASCARPIGVDDETRSAMSIIRVVHTGRVERGSCDRELGRRCRFDALGRRGRRADPLANGARCSGSPPIMRTGQSWTAVFVPESKSDTMRESTRSGRPLGWSSCSAVGCAIEGPGWLGQRTDHALAVIAVLALRRSCNTRPGRRDPFIDLGFFRSIPLRRRR